VRALILYLGLIFVGGALFAPILWHLAQAGARLFPGPVMAHLAQCPFHRFMDRAFLVVALGGLWPFLRALGVNSWQDLGWTPPTGEGRHFLAGLAMGFASLGLAAGLAVWFGGRPLATAGSPGHIAGIFFKALGAAVTVAVLEETLFRGGVFLGLRRVLPGWVALAGSSVIYALVHFLQHGELTGPAHWDSGLKLLPDMFQGFRDAGGFIPGFITLTLAGLLLGMACQQTGTLYCSIGMHGAWVFWLKLYQSFTHDGPGQNSALWGTGKLIDGWASCLVLAGVLAGWILWQRVYRRGLASPAT